MKKLFGVLLAMAMLLTLAVSAAASGDTSVSPEPDPELNLPDGASFALLSSVMVDNETTGGSFFLYIPSNTHGMDGQANGLIYLYPDKPCATEEEAFALLTDLGLLEIAEDFPALVAMPLPLNGESYTDADAAFYDEIRYYASGGMKGMPKKEEDNGPGASERMGGSGELAAEASGETETSREPEGGQDGGAARYISSEHVFAIAEGDGATFVNNVLSQHKTLLSGIMLVGGSIDDGIQPGIAQPVYLIDAPEPVAAFWKATNGTDAKHGNVFYNQSNTQKRVILDEDGGALDRRTVERVWTEMLCKSEQVKVNTAGEGDSFEEIRLLMSWPSLHELPITAYTFDFDAGTRAAEYHELLRTRNSDSVHVFVPDAVLETPDRKVPLVMGMHGAGCGPLELVESCGWLEKAVEENFIVACAATEDTEVIRQIIDYLCAEYPVDTGRIYATGFSLGGVMASTVGKTYPELFAAIAPMGSAGGSYVETFDASAWDLPVCMIVGGSDDLNVQRDADGCPRVVGLFADALPQNFAANEVVTGEADYDANPYWGYTPDDYESFVRNEVEYQISRYYTEQYAAPVVECVTMIGLIHTYSDYMAELAWDFFSQYSRNADGSLTCFAGAAVR